jgi:hypothetical protein
MFESLGGLIVGSYVEGDVDRRRVIWHSFIWAEVWSCAVRRTSTKHLTQRLVTNITPFGWLRSSLVTVRTILLRVSGSIRD